MSIGETEIVRSSYKGAGVVIAILIAMTLLFSVDSHFKITLTTEFTDNGNSDVNIFSVILEGSNTDSNSYKELSIEYKKGDGEIVSSFTQPRSDKIVGFKNDMYNITNNTFYSSFNMSVNWNSDFKEWNEISYPNDLITENDTNFKFIKGNFDSTFNYVNSVDFIKTVGSSSTLETYSYLSIENYSTNDYRYLVNKFKYPNDILARKLYVKFASPDNDLSNSSVNITIKLIDTTNSKVLSYKEISSQDIFYRFSTILNVLNSTVNIVKNRYYNLEIRSSVQKYEWESPRVYVRDCTTIGQIYKYTKDGMTFKNGQELWMSFLSENSITERKLKCSHSTSIGSYDEFIILENIIPLTDLKYKPDMLYNLSVQFSNLTFFNTSYVDSSISSFRSLFDMGYSDKLTNIKNNSKFTINSTEIPNTIFENVYIRFYLTFMSANTFKLKLNRILYNLTYIDVDKVNNYRNISVDMVTGFNTIITTEVDNITLNNGYSFNKTNIYRTIFNLSFVINDSISIKKYNVVKVEESIINELTYTYLTINESPFKLTYTSSKIIVHAKKEEQKTEINGFEYHVYI